jgi:hypothetical protein
MADIAERLDSLRFNRRETGRLGLALTLSLAFHLAVFSSYEIGQRFHLFPALRTLTQNLAMLPKMPAQSPEQPLQFVMVDHPSTEAPENAKYYSSQNSRATNPDADENSKNPKLNGKQTDMPKTENVPKPEFNKLQPSPQPINRDQNQPSQSLQPGDLVLGNPTELQQPQQQQTERPRTLSQVLPHKMPGLMMRQEGGVHQVALQPSLDAKATQFGAYDELFIEAVTQRWYDLLDSQQFALDRTGRVVVRFHLNDDGTISDMTVLDNTVGELLGQVCVDAIHDPAPYAPWPEDLRRLVGATYRDVTFTFYYY